MTAAHMEGNRNALLALHFGEGDDPSVAATRAHAEHCAPCREYLALLATVDGTLRSWSDEPPPSGLRDRVLSRALRPARQVPAPSAAPSAMPLLGLVPVMASLLFAIQQLASWLPTLALWPQLEVSPLIAEVIPFAAATLILLAIGGMATLAMAPALVLENAGALRGDARARA